MKTNGNVNFAADLKGMPVLDSGSGAKIGVVSDLILDPVQGKLAGIAFTRADREVRALALEHVHIGKDAVMITGGTPAALDFAGGIAQGVLATKILGASVVTENGSRIGSLESVWVDPATAQIHYRVAESALQRITGGGFFISGQVPRTFSPDARRLIVPADYDRYAKKSLSPESVPPKK